MTTMLYVKRADGSGFDLGTWNVQTNNVRSGYIANMSETDNREAFFIIDDRGNVHTSIVDIPDYVKNRIRAYMKWARNKRLLVVKKSG